MLELNQHNVADYLKSAEKIATPIPGSETPNDQLLVLPLTGGIANTVLKIFDPNAGPKVGTDMRSPAQLKRNIPDKRMNQGGCFVLKQPLAKFRTADEWLVDIARVEVERDCMSLLGQLLPAGSVPEMLWFDEANKILAMSCAPTDSILWKKQLLAGRVSSEAAQLAAVLLAMMHSSTQSDSAIQARYGDPAFFIQQRTDPYLATLITKHPTLRAAIQATIDELLKTKLCLIHGDFSPKNIFIIPKAETVPAGAAPLAPRGKGKPAPSTISHLMLLDFEVAYYGHPAFDVATLINHLILKAFHLGKPWRACMIAIDAFWQTYQHSADKKLVAAMNNAGRLLGALLLARIDGKSPVEYIASDSPLRETIRTCAQEIISSPNTDLDSAIDHAAELLQKLNA